LTALQRRLDGVQCIGRGALRLGDGPDGAVVLGRGDALAGVDAALDLRQLGGGLIEVLQRDDDIPYSRCPASF
jgi:hypothetical protein